MADKITNFLHKIGMQGEELPIKEVSLIFTDGSVKSLANAKVYRVVYGKTITYNVIPARGVDD